MRRSGRRGSSSRWGDRGRTLRGRWVGGRPGAGGVLQKRTQYLLVFQGFPFAPYAFARYFPVGFAQGNVTFRRFSAAFRKKRSSGEGCGGGFRGVNGFDRRDGRRKSGLFEGRSGESEA